MQVNELLIAVVKNTDGWVFVVVFGLYVGYHIYRRHSEGVALTRTLNMLDGTLKSLLENIDRNVSILTTKVDQFLTSLRSNR